MARSLVIALVVAVALPILAQEAPEEEKLGDLETQKTAAMSEVVYKDLARAQEASEAGNFSEAIRLLDKLTAKELNSYERIQAWNLYAFVYYSQERYPQAIQSFEKVLREEAVNDSIRATTTFSLAQLYFATENWRKALEMLESWLAMPGVKPTVQHQELIAQAHYQLGDYRQVIAPMRKAIDEATAAGQPVKEQWYLLLRVAYYELGQHKEAAAVLEDLIRRFPSEKYWLQLVSVYGEMGDEKKQLNTMELAYIQGFLQKEAEILSYYGLLLNNSLPYRAAKVLEKALADGKVESSGQNWRYLAQAWRLAQEDEKAIPALTRAADLTRNGDYDLLLAQSLMNLEKWEQAAAAARKAITKGVNRPDEANVLLGQSLFNAEAFNEARQAFEKAQSDSRSRSLATQWIRYIDSEIDRRAQLAAAIAQ